MAVQPRIEQAEAEQEPEDTQEPGEAEQSIEKSKKILDECTHSADLRDSHQLEEVTTTILETLDFLNEVDCLNKFLKDTKYYIFDWAVKNHNLSVVDYLLQPECLLWKDRYLMIEHDGFLPVKAFVKSSLLLSYEKYQELAAIKEEILFKIIAVHPGYIVPFIKDEMHYRMRKENCTIEPALYAAFKKTFKIARREEKEITQHSIEKEIQLLEQVKRNITNAIDASRQALVEKLNNQNDSSHSENNAPSPR